MLGSEQAAKLRTISSTQANAPPQLYKQQQCAGFRLNPPPWNGNSTQFITTHQAPALCLSWQHLAAPFSSQPLCLCLQRSQSVNEKAASMQVSAREKTEEEASWCMCVMQALTTLNSSTRFTTHRAPVVCHSWQQERKERDSCACVRSHSQCVQALTTLNSSTRFTTH